MYISRSRQGMLYTEGIDENAVLIFNLTIVTYRKIIREGEGGEAKHTSRVLFT